MTRLWVAAGRAGARRCHPGNGGRSMTRRNWRRVWVLGWLWMGCCGVFAAEAEFTVASYNLENYLELPIGSRPVKPEDSRAKIQESLLTLRADVPGGARDWFGGRPFEVARRLKAPDRLPALGTRDRIRYQHPRGGAQPISFYHPEAAYRRRIPPLRPAIHGVARFRGS